MGARLAWTLVLVLAAGAIPAAAQSGASIVVNGVPVSLAAPAVMQDGQVMIPAIRVFEAFRAAATWHPADRSLLITNRTGLTIRLRLGDPTAIVNGQPRPLPVAPMLLRDLPYVPAHAIFMLLGAWVRFDEATRTLHVASQITALHLRRGDGAVRVVLDATGPLRAETRLVTKPDRLVVDLHGGAFRPADQDLAVRDAGVLRVRAGQFQVKPYVTRVVFDLQQPVDVRTVAAAESFAFSIEVRPRGLVAAQGSVGVPGLAPAPAAGAGPVAADAIPPAAEPQGPNPPASSPPALPPISSTPVVPPAAGQIPRGPEMPSTHEALGVPTDVAPDDGIPRVLQVRVEQLGVRFRVLIEATLPLEFTVRELLEPDRIVVDLPGAIFVPVKQEIPVAGAVVVEVRAAQFQADPHITRVVVVLRRKAVYTIAPANDSGSVVGLEIPEPSLRAHVVAIDAGHGGRDPGAIGPTGVQEKDVVLDIAQRLRELLVRAGIRVVMTRETDSFVELPDRPRAARQQGGTVFVSIHANASTRPAANGSETYYLSPQSQVLAQMVQEELARIQGLASRGIRTANFLVLRESDVPAVLVEVAYVSSVDEEARLRQQAFRQRLADAISRGVQRFLAVYPVPAN